MATMLDKVQTAKKICNVIFCLDSSESMDGAPIGALNDAVENLLPDLASQSKKNSSIDIRVSVMSFNTEAQWIIESLTPEQAHDSWQSLEARGMTSMGEAFKSLNEKLNLIVKHTNAPLVAPLLILFSDGEPTDDYLDGLKVLKTNGLYDIATRIAIGYGDFNDRVLRNFTRNVETVFHADNLPDLQKLIKLTTITSIQSSLNPARNSNLTKDNTQKAADLIKAQGILDETIGDEQWDDIK